MEEKFITQAEALNEIKKGKTVYYNMSDGYSTIKKKSNGVYEFVIHINKSDTKIYYGGINNLLKTLNDSAFKDSLYLKEKG
jgi:hypothetical protein